MNAARATNSFDVTDRPLAAAGVASRTFHDGSGGVDAWSWAPTSGHSAVGNGPVTTAADTGTWSLSGGQVGWWPGETEAALIGPRPWR